MRHFANLSAKLVAVRFGCCFVGASSVKNRIYVVLLKEASVSLCVRAYMLVTNE